MSRLILACLFLTFFKLSYFTASAGKTPKTLIAIATKFECNVHNTSIIKKLECSLKPQPPSIPLLNLLVVHRHDVAQINAIFTLFGQQPGSKGATLPPAHINFCDSLTALNKNFVFAFVLREIGRAGNFPLGCPLIKDVEYRLNNLNVSSIYLPPYLPKLNWMVKLEMFYEDQKYVTYQIYGAINKQ